MEPLGVRVVEQLGDSWARAGRIRIFRSIIPKLGEYSNILDDVEDRLTA